MADTASRHVLTEAIWPAEGAALWVKRAVLLVLGIVALTIAAKVKVPVWPSPVAISLGTFAVLTIGAAYGPRLGLATMLGWMLIGALGFDVFQSSSAENVRPRLHDGPDRRLPRSATCWPRSRSASPPAAAGTAASAAWRRRSSPATC